MSHTLFIATECARCKIAKRFMDERGIDYNEFDIKGDGMHVFREFYGANRRSIFRGKDGVEFPVFTDGTAVRQGVGVVIAYLLAGKKLDGFIGRSELSKGWINGLHISGGDPSLVDQLITVLSFLKRNRLRLQLGTNGKNAAVLEKLLEQGFGDHVFMDVKGPVALYNKLLGEEIDPSEIEKSIALVTKFPEYEFQTTVAPVIRDGGQEPDISYLTHEEIGETAQLIEKATGSKKQPYLLRIFTPETCSDERLKAVEKLPYNAMFRYRTVARKHQVLTEIEKM